MNEQRKTPPEKLAEKPAEKSPEKLAEKKQARVFRNERGLLCAEIGGLTIHSTRNPQKEAEKLMSHMADPKAKGLLVFGLGLGYHLRALADLFPQKEVICFEPDPLWPALIAREGIHAGDLAAKIIFPDSTLSNLQDYFHEGYQLIALESYRRIYPELFALVEGLHKKYSSRNAVNQNTLKRFGLRWVENLLINFLCLERQQSINIMRNTFPGFPALLLAGGPTLRSILPLLEHLRQRMIILAVDTSYSPCREAGIEPDFLIAVDPQYWNTKHFERLRPVPGGPKEKPEEGPEGRPEERPEKEPVEKPEEGSGENTAILISESSAHPRTFRLLKRQPYFCGSLFPLGDFFEQHLPPRDKLGAGGSVATTAWSFLRYIGATKIYTAGMDMGFPNRKTHFHGSYFEETIAMSGTSLLPAETAALSYLLSGRPEYRESYSGRALLSDSRMDLYCQWFEHQIQQDDEVMGASLSEESRKIPGMGLAKPEELLSLPNIRMEIDGRLARIRQSASAQPQREGLMAASVSEALQGSMEDMATQCRQALEIIGEYHHNRSPAAQTLDRLQNIDRRLLSDETRNIAGFLISDVVNSLIGLPDPETLPDAMKRSEELYRRLLESTDGHIRIFRKTMAKIKNSAQHADNKAREQNGLC